MKSFTKLFYLLLCLPIFLLSCNKDDEKQDDLPPAAPEFKFIETALHDYYDLDKTPISIDFLDDQLYIADNEMEVGIFDDDFTFVRIFTNSGNVPIKAYTVRFKRQSGFYIHNQNYNYLMCFDESGHREAELNNLPDLDNDYISAMDIDLLDNVFLIYNSNTIHKYNPDLSTLISTTTLGDLFDHASYDFTVMAIAVDNNQNVYVSIDVNDTQNEGLDAVLKFDNELNFVKSIGGNWLFSGPCGIAFDNNNYMYVVNRWHSVVKVFNTKLNSVATSGDIDVSGDTDGLLDEPIGIRINNNRVYITEKENHRISVFTTYR